MKSLFLFFCLVALIWMPLEATDYYSKSSGYINVLSSWSATRDGSGSSPSSFRADNQKFYVQNGHTKTAIDDWTVSGSQSWVIVETGGQITSGAYNHNIPVELRSGSTYEMTNTSYSYLDAVNWDTASTFILNNASANFDESISYGNLILRNGEAAVRGSTGLTVRGTLTVESSGEFDGGLTNGHTNSIANINVTGGYFYGCTGAATVVYNISGSVNVSGSAYFFGSEGAGTVTYNVGGDFTVGSSAWFYASFRSTSDLAPNVYNIAGSLSVPGSNYFARNRDSGGYPSFYLSGVNEDLALGSATSTLSCQHNVYINSGASYSLTQNINVGQACELRINGTLKGENYQVKNYASSDPTINIYGSFYTKRATGLVGNSTDAIALASEANLYIRSGSRIWYDASGDQTISDREYQYLNLSGSGNKTLSDGDITVQTALSVYAPLVISSSLTIMLNGSLESTSTITGGKLHVAGTASQLNLPAATLGYLQISRSNGCILTGNVTVETIYLQAGTLSIGSRTLQITGSVSYGSGTLTGTSNSYLVIGGTGDLFTLKTITLYALTVSRPNGCLLTGNVNTTDVNLNGGNLSIGSYTLQIGGGLSISSGSLVGGSSSNLTLVGNATITIPSLTLATLNNSRNNTVSMGGNLTVGTLQLYGGTFSVGSNTLTINTRLVQSGGILSTHYGSTLAYTSTSYMLSLPACNLYRFDLNSSQGCALNGNLSVNHLSLTSTSLDLKSNSATILSSISATSSTITGLSGSTLDINFFAAAGISLPQLTVGNLICQGNMNYNFSPSSRILTQLQLKNGTVKPSTNLSLASGCAINRYSGTIDANPSYEGTITVSYYIDASAGYEIPSSSAVLTTLVLKSGVDVESDRDIYVSQAIRLETNAILTMDQGVLYVPANLVYTQMPGCLVIGEVQTSVGNGGFDFRIGDLVVGGGVSIPDFSSNLSTTPVDLQNGPSINRVWDLSGTFSGNASLTFEWDSSADNGLGFAPDNLACVMRRSGDHWVQVGDAVDVSSLSPRSITVSTTGFSEWTIGSELSTLPVTLSSFTATPTQTNYVLLNWTTQSESNLSGFRLLRAHQNNLVNAQDLNILIPATNSSTLQNYSYTDAEVVPPAIYYYWLAWVELDGSVYYSHSVAVQLSGQPQPDIPPLVELPLIKAWPNPFNPILSLRIAQKADGFLSLDIYNQKGQLIRKLHSGWLARGTHCLEWDGRDGLGRECASGIYLIRCRTRQEEAWSRVSLLK